MSSTCDNESRRKSLSGIFLAFFLSQNWGFLRKSACACANAYANTYAFAYAYALVTRLRSKLNKFPSKTSKNGRPNAWLLQNEDCNYLTLKAALI